MQRAKVGQYFIVNVDILDCSLNPGTSCLIVLGKPSDTFLNEVLFLIFLPALAAA